MIDYQGKAGNTGHMVSIILIDLVQVIAQVHEYLSDLNRHLHQLGRHLLRCVPDVLVEICDEVNEPVCFIP